MKKLLLISKRAFYPSHWEAFKRLCKTYHLSGFVITTKNPKIPISHQLLGTGHPTKDFNPKIYYPSTSRDLLSYLQTIKPDYIWVQEEPTNQGLLLLLARYFLSRQKPHIICAVCENIFHPARFVFQPLRILLWSRLNGLLPVAKYSLSNVQNVGMPKTVPYVDLAAGFIAPPKKVTEFTAFTKSKTDFVVGFVGRLVPEKGWETLFKALSYLPKNVKLIMIGSGGDQEEIDALIRKGYQGRIFRFDVMPKEKLWGVYKKMDCFVLPSFDSVSWKEQSGGVLADAMSMGIPIVGSISGGIPDIIGDAGLLFPQKNAKLLASSINTLLSDKNLRQELSLKGLKRFSKEFSIISYSEKIAQALKLTI